MSAPAEPARFGFDEAATGLGAEVSQLARPDDRLQAGADAKAAIDRVEALLDPTSGQSDDLPDLAREVVFAPKELKVAQDLSERLGYTTVPGRSRSRPSGLSKGGRSVSESDHRRALMLPQELIQLPPDRLIVLRAGSPPIRGRKIAYYRERAFLDRVLSPPSLRPMSVAEAGAQPSAPAAPTDGAADRLDLDHVDGALASAGLAPPARGASEAEMEAWVERFIDGGVPLPDLEPAHG